MTSGDVNDSAWDTNPSNNPYHNVHFDELGNSDNPCTDTYTATDADYHDDSNYSKSYCGGPPSKSNKSIPPAFVINNFTNPETKEYSYWYHAKPNAQPPAGLMYFYVAAYYCKEIALIDEEHKNHNLHLQDAHRCHFLTGMCQTYCSLTSTDEPEIFDIKHDQKL